LDPLNYDSEINFKLVHCAALVFDPIGAYPLFAILFPYLQHLSISIIHSMGQEESIPTGGQSSAWLSPLTQVSCPTKRAPNTEAKGLNTYALLLAPGLHCLPLAGFPCC